MENRHRKRWSAHEILKLYTMVSISSPRNIAKALGRTTIAVVRKMEKMKLTPGQGHYSVRDIEEKTGYARSQLVRAKESLGQHWQRKPDSGGYRKRSDARKTNRRYQLTEQQLEELCDWLRDEDGGEFRSNRGNYSQRWARQYDCCKECDTNGTEPKERHYAHGGPLSSCR